jgi:hypothetical protein
MAVRVDVDGKAVRDLLTSREVEAELRTHAERIARQAGPGHRVESSRRGNRARAAVLTDTVEAMVAEATDHNLLRAVDAGRL